MARADMNAMADTFAATPVARARLCRLESPQETV